MIPQAIVSSGAYADLWTTLKSMEHALRRVSSAQSVKEISELDRERLAALEDFLKSQLEAKDQRDLQPNQAFLACQSLELEYTLDADLRSLLQDIPAFKEWLKSLPFKEKASRLISTPQEYMAKLSGTLLPPVPKTEFAILNELLGKLLSETESALIR